MNTPLTCKNEPRSRGATNPQSGNLASEPVQNRDRQEAEPQRRDGAHQPISDRARPRGHLGHPNCDGVIEFQLQDHPITKSLNQYRCRQRVFRHIGIAILLTLPLSSCTYTGGELLYNLGFGRSKKVPAQFQLSEGRLLVLIDDVNELVDWPPAQAYLFDQLTQDLIRHGAAKKIIPGETIDGRRRTMPDFNKLSCREVGELLGADQVLWIETKDFLAEEDFADTGASALWNVVVRVIDPNQKDSREKVRLWPESPAGHMVSAELSAAETLRLKSKDAIAKALVSKLAARITLLFFEHRLDDPAIGS